MAKYFGPATHVRDSHGDPGPWLEAPGQAPIPAAIWKMNKQKDLFLSSSLLSHFLSCFQICKINSLKDIFKSDYLLLKETVIVCQLLV